VTVCRDRGIADVRWADLNDHTLEGRWDTILLMCGNLGLGGDWDPSRELLRRLAGMTSPGGPLIGDSVDPASEIRTTSPTRNGIERAASIGGTSRCVCTTAVS
jgi:hypothetical protein